MHVIKQVGNKYVTTRNQKSVSAPERAGACLASFLGIALTVGLSGTALGQEPEFGIAPSAHTQEALSTSPTVPSQTQEGLYAAVGVAYSHRSNVARDSVAGAGSKGDSALVISPQAGYKRFFGRHTAEVGISSQITRFKDFTDENTQNYTAHALANLDLTRILDLDLFATFTHTAEPRGGSGTRLIQSPTPDKVDITGYGGKFTIGQRSSRLQLEVGADRSQWRYKNNQQQFRDRDEDSVRGRVYYNISPRTSVFVGSSLTDINYNDQTLNADSRELEYDLGARWDITAKTTGEVSAGRTRKNFDNPALSDATATTVAGRLSWTPRERTSFSLYGSRQFEEIASTTGDFYISELIGVSVHESIAERWGVFAYLNHTNDDYESGRNDNIKDYGVGLDYSFRRWLALGAKYSRVERNSNLPGEDYTDNIFTVYLNGTLGVGSR